MAETEKYKLSLTTAILININIMLGAGIFINTPSLAQRAGILSAIIYPLVGLLMLPLILSIAELLKKHPVGGFYTFAAKEIHPMAGFLSCWCYFTAKIASCALMVHASIALLQHIFPLLAGISIFLLDFLTVGAFTVLNLLNMKAGSAIQKAFIGFKIFPLLFAIAGGFLFMQSDNLYAEPLKWEGLPLSLPLVIYAVVGFEAACSMSGQIRNAQKNAPLAVLISFFTVIAIATLYQTAFYVSLGEQLVQCDSHCEVFPSLIRHIFGNGPWTHQFEALLQLAIAFSTLGAAYGIIFSNGWNLYTLAQNDHLWNSSFFAQFNKSQIPVACVVAEGVVAILYLVVSQGVLIPLQQIGAFGSVIAYTLSVASLLSAQRGDSSVGAARRWIPRLGLCSCAILVTACLRSFLINGASSLAIFSLLLILGATMFLRTARRPLIEEAGNAVS
jgi:amino acid transporter